jgi:hypothetical protein
VAVGANAVVTSDVPGGSVVAGVPARVISHGGAMAISTTPTTERGRCTLLIGGGPLGFALAVVDVTLMVEHQPPLGRSVWMASPAEPLRPGMRDPRG